MGTTPKTLSPVHGASRGSASANPSGSRHENERHTFILRHHGDGSTADLKTSARRHRVCRDALGDPRRIEDGAERGLVSSGRKIAHLGNARRVARNQTDGFSDEEDLSRSTRCFCPIRCRDSAETPVEARIEARARHFPYCGGKYFCGSSLPGRSESQYTVTIHQRPPSCSS